MGGVIVLGAGLAGLGFARHSPGCRVFEAAEHLGGHAYSHAMDGIHFDQGAHISHTKDDAFRELIDGAAGAVAAVAASVVRNRWQGRWITYPVQNHLRELPPDARIRALTDLVEAHTQTANEPDNYRDWCRRQYGRYLAENFYDEYTAKYWRVPAESLATDWLGGRLLPSMLPRIIHGAFAQAPEEQAVFARFRYPARGGFFAFFAPLYRDLDVVLGERAVEIDAARKLVRFASGRIEAYDALATSIPLPDLMKMIRGVPIELLDLAARLRHTQLLCVNLIVDRPYLTDCHWFYVYDRDIETSRVSLPGNLAPGSVPDGRTALQAEIFRRDDEPMETDLLVERTIDDMGRLFGFSRWEVRQAGHIHVKRAYVISDQRRAEIVAVLLDWLQRRDVHSMGLYGRWKYVWSDEAYRQGRQTAERLGARSEMRQAA
jgi:protoporphyrinogen oxidase